jgi:hypothetical protein
LWVLSPAVDGCSTNRLLEVRILSAQPRSRLITHRSNPLLPATTTIAALINLVGAPELAIMKPTARLVNASRGPIVVDADLIPSRANTRASGKLRFIAKVLRQ